MRRADRGRRSPWRLWATLCLLAGLALPESGQAAALIETKINGAPVRLVADRATDRVLLQASAARALFDLAGGSVYLDEGDAVRRVHARFRPGHDAPPPFRLERFGPGPVIAGFVTTYHVLFVEEQVCAELMTGGWMAPFVDPAIRALAILQALEPASSDPCQAIPFTTYAAAGWPLIAGKIDHPTIETTRIAFDYQPRPDELALPTTFAEGDLRHLRKIAKAAGL